MELELPYPPSVNHLWRRFRNRTVLSSEGREYRRAIRVVLAGQGVRPIAGPLAVAIDVYPPDRRRRDLDNLNKALLDALAHGGAYHDDFQIDRLTITRCIVVPGGQVRVRVTPYAAPVSEPIPRQTTAAKPRGCLKCGKTFDSIGPGNRICAPCQRKNAHIPLGERELQAQRGLKRCNGEILSDHQNVAS